MPRLAPLLAVALVLAVAACANPHEVRRKHPIMVNVEELSMVMRPPAADGALGVGDAGRLDALVDDYRRRGEGPVHVTMGGFASTGEAERRGLVVLDELVARGLHPDLLRLFVEPLSAHRAAAPASADQPATHGDEGTGRRPTGAYAAGHAPDSAPDGAPDSATDINIDATHLAAVRSHLRPATAVISFMGYVAEVPQCGDWSEDLSNNFDNEPADRFGCAVQRNIGLMVSNPRDLIHSRSDPRSGLRAGPIMDAYSAGDLTTMSEGASVGD
ncbi:CpaD family pilus assembly lipoprotein [Roseospirillum parvum]|uniref:Pilus biogenesis lipoprotein CpaD n=1 Tax=Roseospirillum parvum TaxID=83401 RepID=A0A1G8C0G3_9PROT|nr:CpaD family pilus assembly lipoprotein [Roseospirillum parvum]SDH38793.1 pilus biogenesis lipoprotein CpaD [Roseospirillum parvum]